MPYSHTAARPRGLIEPNAGSHYQMTPAGLPPHCPLGGMSLWNLYPRPYLDVQTTGKAKCPRCGAQYTLVD